VVPPRKRQQEPVTEPFDTAQSSSSAVPAPARTTSEPVELEKIRVPALVVWGAEDQLISAEAGRRAAARMPSSEFVLMEGVGHVPMEEKPDELIRIVLPFLERHSLERQ